MAPDQDYINAMCYNHIKYLSDRYDAMPNPNNRQIENPIIIHYNLFLKPWQYDEVQYKNNFWKYAKDTPYYDEIKNIKENYSEKDKKQDNKFMNQMIERAYALTKEQKTLKNVFETGKEQRL